MLNAVDWLLDRVTMYKLLRYYLATLLVVAFAISWTGRLPFTPLALTVCSLLALGACWTINQVFSYIFKAPTSTDSSLITGFILALLITPSLDKLTVLFVLAASGLAMASKYILAIKRKHIFNPAAIALVLLAFGPQQTPSWWVGTAAMMPFVLVGGLLVARKVRRSLMIGVFLAVTFSATALYAGLSGADIGLSLQRTLLRSAVVFLAFVMLTEPATSPTTKATQVWYAALVGLLVPPQAHLLSYYSSPEVALVIGNAFSYLVSSKKKLFLVLKEKTKIAAHAADFVFYPEKQFAYKPGQYMEFTLPHAHSDSRGDRRYFTLASSPTEQELRIGVKFYDKGSSYKTAMLAMDHNTPIVADHVSGDFTLPDDPAEKLVFIAGGIGITPFRSMVKYLLDTNSQRQVSLVYAARTSEDIAYKPVFDEAAHKLGMRTTYVLSDGAMTSAPGWHTGTVITPDIIAAEIPDYTSRTFYISGTHPMVAHTKRTLRDMGVPSTRIKIDFFPGYA